MTSTSRPAENAAIADAKFRAMFEQGAQFAGILSPDGVVVEVNRRALEASGFRRDQVLGVPFWACGWWTPADDVSAAMRFGCEEAAAGRPFRTFSRYFLSDGSMRYAEVAITPVVDDEGRVPFLAATGTDVTERKRIEEELAERELRYRLVADAAHDAIWDWNLLNDQVVWNDGLRARFGYEDTLNGSTAQWWIDHIHREDMPRIRDSVRAHIEGGALTQWCEEYRFRRADGSYAVVADSGRVVRDPQGVAVRMVGSMLDLTERKRAEAKLRDAEERLAFVRAASGVGFWYCDLPFDVLQWDEHVKAHFHLPRDARVTIETFYAIIHVDDRERVRAAIERSIATHTPYHIDYRTVSPTGDEKWIRAIGRTFYAEDDTPMRFDGATIDVTDQKRTEEHLARLLDEEKRLSERVREQDRRKDEFLATLAHELRNPLAPVRTGLAVLQASSNAETVTRTREMMERQVAHMVRLIDDLLDISRITRDKVELKRERLDARAVIDAALEVSRPAIEAGRHRITVAVSGGSLPLFADATRIAQVVSNLLNNAAKYTPPEGSIELSAERMGDDVVIRVRDSGIGIPPEMLPRIFEMFTQVNRSLHRSQGGLGIGLSLVQKLVEMHGGTIVAESEGDGRGCTFTVRLPRAADEPRSSPRIERAAEAPTTGHRVLVVDDNADAAEMLATLLSLDGHEATTAHDGAAALRAAEEGQPEVVFLDIGMPGMDGYEVARRLRARPSTKSVFLVALTGWGTDEDQKRAFDAGFDRHLTKPVDPAKVSALLRGR